MLGVKLWNHEIFHYNTHNLVFSDQVLCISIKMAARDKNVGGSQTNYHT